MKTDVHCKSHLYQQRLMFVSAETIRTKLSSKSVDHMLIYVLCKAILLYSFFFFCFKAADAAMADIRKVIHVLLMLFRITMLLYPIPSANNIMNLKVGKKIV